MPTCLVAAIVIALSACGGTDGPTGAPPTPTSIALVTTPPTSASAGLPVSTAPTFNVLDQNGDVMSGVAVTVTIATGGGTLVGAPTTTAAGAATSIGAWTLGRTAGTNSVTITAGSSATITVTVTGIAGPPSLVTVVSGDGQAIFGGRTAAPVQFAVTDQFANGIPGQTLAFSQVGGGVLQGTTGVTGAGGIVNAPTWTVGRSVVPQQLRADLGTISGHADATVRTSFDIEVRFFGPAMTAAQQELFLAAAARIRAMVVGDIPNVNATGFDLNTGCGVPGQPLMAGVIDDVVIYASIAAIDGPGKILAQAGACAGRDSANGAFPAIGVMEFDSTDLASLSGGGSLQNVITHEMMHVIGFDADFFDFLGIITDYDGPNVAFTGVNGIAGCRQSSGTVTCATSVPLENTGGAGTKNSHWRESKFNNELMTGFLNNGINPISAMTIGAFQDLGYQVNLEARDTYLVPGGSLQASGGVSRVIVGDGWERSLFGSSVIAANGRTMLHSRLTLH